MLNSDERYRHYVQLQTNTQNILLSKSENADEEFIRTVLPSVLSLLMSSIEALHIIAESSRDQAMTFRRVNGLEIKR